MEKRLIDRFEAVVCQHYRGRNETYFNSVYESREE